MLIPETDDDLGNAEQKRLGPEFQQLPLVLNHVSLVVDFGGCLQFYPIDGVLFSLGLAVPD